MGGQQYNDRLTPDGRCRFLRIRQYPYWWHDGEKFRFTFLSVRLYVPVEDPDGTE